MQPPATACAKQPREAAARIRVDVGGHGPAIRIHLGNHRAVATARKQRRARTVREIDSRRRPRAPRTGADPCRAGTRSGQDRAAARRRSRCRFPRAVHAAPRRPASRPARPAPFGMSQCVVSVACARNTRPAASRDHDAARQCRRAAPRFITRVLSASAAATCPRPSCGIDGLERHRLALRGDLGRDFAAGLAVRLGRARRELRIDSCARPLLCHVVVSCLRRAPRPFRQRRAVGLAEVADRRVVQEVQVVLAWAGSIAAARGAGQHARDDGKGCTHRHVFSWMFDRTARCMPANRGRPSGTHHARQRASIACVL